MPDQIQFIMCTEDQLSAMITRAIEKCLASAKVKEETPKPVLQNDSYTSKELQAMLSVSSTTIYNYENEGLLKPITIKRRKIYLRADIEKLFEDNRFRRRKK